MLKTRLWSSIHVQQAENSERGMKNIQMTFTFELINNYYISVTMQCTECSLCIQCCISPA